MVAILCKAEHKDDGGGGILQNQSRKQSIKAFSCSVRHGNRAADGCILESNLHIWHCLSVEES